MDLPKMMRCNSQFFGASIPAGLSGGRYFIPTFIVPLPQTHVGLAPLRARAAHIVQLGTISLIGQHCPPITGELSAQSQSRGGET